MGAHSHSWQRYAMWMTLLSWQRPFCPSFRCRPPSALARLVSCLSWGHRSYGSASCLNLPLAFLIRQGAL